MSPPLMLNLECKALDILPEVHILAMKRNNNTSLAPFHKALN